MLYSSRQLLGLNKKTLHQTRGGSVLQGKGRLYLTQDHSLVAEVSYRLRRVQTSFSRLHDWIIDPPNFNTSYQDLRAPGTPISVDITLELDNGTEVQMSVTTSFSPSSSQWRWQYLSGLD